METIKALRSIKGHYRAACLDSVLTTSKFRVWMQPGFGFKSARWLSMTLLGEMFLIME